MIKKIRRQGKAFEDELVNLMRKLAQPKNAKCGRNIGELKTRCT